MNKLRSPGRRLRALSLALLIALPSGLGLYPLAAEATTTFDAMKTSSENALNARINGTVTPLFDNVKQMAPSKLSCLAKWQALGFSDLLTGNWMQALKALVTSIVTGMLNTIVNMVCAVSNSAWNIMAGNVAKISTDVTLPGGAGSVKVGLQANSNGQITQVLSGTVMGQSVYNPTAYPSTQPTGSAPNQSLFDVAKEWVTRGIDRTKSWYQ